MAAILEQVQRAPEGELGLSTEHSSVADEAGGQPDVEAVEEDPRVLQSLERERRHLQKVVALAAVIPVVAGLWGVLFGPALTGDRLGVSGESHYRYLAGLLFAIGLLFWSTIPNIEATGPRFRLLTLLVFIGGLARLLGLTLTGVPSLSMLGALVMELVVTPLLCLWQWRVARGYLVEDKKPAARRPVATAPPAEALSRRTGPTAAVMPDDLPEPIPTPVATPASGESKPPTPSP